MAQLKCNNSDCPEYQIVKENPYNLTDVVCGHCGQPVEETQ